MYTYMHLHTHTHTYTTYMYQSQSPLQYTCSYICIHTYIYMYEHAYTPYECTYRVLSRLCQSVLHAWNKVAESEGDRNALEDSPDYSRESPQRQNSRDLRSYYKDVRRRSHSRDAPGRRDSGDVPRMRDLRVAHQQSHSRDVPQSTSSKNAAHRSHSNERSRSRDVPHIRVSRDMRQGGHSRNRQWEEGMATNSPSDEEFLENKHLDNNKPTRKEARQDRNNPANMGENMYFGCFLLSYRCSLRVYIQALLRCTYMRTSMLSQGLALGVHTCSLKVYIHALPRALYMHALLSALLRCTYRLLLSQVPSVIQMCIHALLSR
jgi:hypothetical protein